MIKRDFSKALYKRSVSLGWTRYTTNLCPSKVISIFINHISFGSCTNFLYHMV